jgi:hypothetical protein
MAGDKIEHTFTATGPSPHDEVVPAGFATHSDELDAGVNVQGNSVGLYAESVNAGTGRKPPTEPNAGIGVCGVGDGFGVLGAIHKSPNRNGLAGVVGEHRGGGVGMVGVSMDTAAGAHGIGVAGMSHTSSNPGELASPPDPARGHGIGVLGSSGNGTGVRGTSAQGVGVVGVSQEAAGVQAGGRMGVEARGQQVGVHATGRVGVDATGQQVGVHTTGRVGVLGEGSGGPGGEFKSHETHAQLRLVPHGPGVTPTTAEVPSLEHRIPANRLPKDGELGDLLVTSHGDTNIQCLLWLCVDGSAGNAKWAQVLLGRPIQGTRPVTEEG